MKERRSDPGGGSVKSSTGIGFTGSSLSKADILPPCEYSQDVRPTAKRLFNMNQRLSKPSHFALRPISGESLRPAQGEPWHGGRCASAKHVGVWTPNAAERDRGRSAWKSATEGLCQRKFSRTARGRISGPSMRMNRH